jgi:TRAP-type mannitol/chloroaromatic compound transport system substrate-binding protein
MLEKTTKILLASVAAIAISTGVATAQEVTTLRMQSHNSPTSPYGVAIQSFVDNVRTMSNGTLEIEFFFSSSVVPSAETFDAAKSGILDCDMTNASYQTGKNAAFQFVSDTLGGYDTPLQFLAWVELGGGEEAINELYSDHNMTLIGAFVGGQESLNSTRPLRGVADLQGFKFRSPPGMESDIFASLGASPIVMDFTEVITALESGIIDGADASTLATNLSIGVYDVAKHTTYPGFHSMSSDHLACNTDVWNSLSDQHKKILEVAVSSVALEVMLSTLVLNGEALKQLPDKDVTFYDWSSEDRATFRAAAQEAWDDWGTRTPEAKKLVASHVAFLKRIGLSE